MRNKANTGIARVARAHARALAACENTYCISMVSRPARASKRERGDLRLVVHVLQRVCNWVWVWVCGGKEAMRARHEETGVHDEVC